MNACGKVSILFGQRKINNMSVYKGILRGIDVHNTYKRGGLLFTIIFYCLQI